MLTLGWQDASVDNGAHCQAWKPGDLNLSSRPHVVEEEKQQKQLS